jgi:hypothetical protein
MSTDTTETADFRKFVKSQTRRERKEAHSFKASKLIRSHRGDTEAKQELRKMAREEREAKAKKALGLEEKS